MDLWQLLAWTKDLHEAWTLYKNLNKKFWIELCDILAFLSAYWVTCWLLIDLQCFALIVTTACCDFSRTDTINLAGFVKLMSVRSAYLNI